MTVINFDDIRRSAVEAYLASTKSRRATLRLIERIMFIMSNAKDDAGMLLRECKLDEILGDSYKELEDDERDAIFNVFLEEVELGKLGIFHQGNGIFYMKTSLKDRFLGEKDLKDVKLKSLVDDLKKKEIKPESVGADLIDYIHQFYGVGYEFTLEDIFGEYWWQIDWGDRVEIGSQFAFIVHKGTCGIVPLKTSGGNIAKEEGKNKYIISYIAS